MRDAAFRPCTRIRVWTGTDEVDRRNTKPAWLGRVTSRQGRGNDHSWRIDLPRQPGPPSSGKREFSATAELCRQCRALAAGLRDPEGEALFAENMGAAIDAARTLARMDELARKVWQAHASGAVDDDAAQALAERLHERRKAVRGTIVPVGIPAGRVSLFPPRRPVRSPDRWASLARRRQLAASGPMPPALASRFTTGQLAVLRVVGDEIARQGACALCLDAIAARAGVCRRLAQGAIRLAEGDGLLIVQERRHEGRKNDPNVVRILSREWLAWLRRGSRTPAKAPALFSARVGEGASPSSTGCKRLHPTDSKVPILAAYRPSKPSQKLPERQRSTSTEGRAWNRGGR